MNIAAKANKVRKSIEKLMSLPSKTRKHQKPMNIAAKANKVCKSIKKPMSIPSKTRKEQKNHKRCSKSELGLQKHQKAHEHTIKNKQR